jgi:hypothetical protein
MHCVIGEKAWLALLHGDCGGCLVHRRAGIPEASSGGAHNNLTRSTKKKTYV